MRVRAVVAGAVCALLAVGGAGYAVVAAGSSSSSDAAGPRAQASIDGWRWAPRDEFPLKAASDDKPAPKPAATTKAAEPKPAEKPVKRSSKPDVDPVEAQSSRTVERVENDLASGAASGKDDVLVKAEVLKNGVALPPLESPPEVRAIFEAGNTIARSPYKWGGGHGKWRDTGYDCSGSVSYALAAAGLLSSPQASGPLMHYGKPGKGKWITIYSNPGHVWMVVAGVRFDTVARGQTGSRWINDIADTSGYVARHPPGF